MDNMYINLQKYVNFVTKVNPMQFNKSAHGCNHRIEYNTDIIVEYYISFHLRIHYKAYLLSSETTAKGTGLEISAGKEDPVELDSSLTL